MITPLHGYMAWLQRCIVPFTSGTFLRHCSMAFAALLGVVHAVAHKSGGPLMDIIVPHEAQDIGFLATTAEEYGRSTQEHQNAQLSTQNTECTTEYPCSGSNPQTDARARAHAQTVCVQIRQCDR
jgi:hypothetical protein